MNPVELFIFEKEGNQKLILEFLHHWLIKSYPGIQAKIRYGIPFYYKNKWICYMNPIKNGQVEIAFTRANLLKNENGLLQFGTRKQVAGVIIQDLATLPIDALKASMAEAIELDSNTKYSIKKK